MNIEIWSDVVCPWCWLGVARFSRALRSSSRQIGSDDPITVTMRSFQLDPHFPLDQDVSTTEHLKRKYGWGPEQIAAAHARLEQMGREEGIEFRFDRVRTSNTFEAHQLIHLARSQGKEREMADRLCRANFHDGIRIGERAALLPLAEEVGVTQAEPSLVAQTFASAVRQEQTRARELGISGVPFFLRDGRTAMSGAQPIEVMREFVSR